jgi:hypothetical protein
MAKNQKDALSHLRQQVDKYITDNYSTVEEFYWDKDLNKATISNFLRSKKDFRVSTLVQISQAIGKNLVIKLD